MWNETENFLNDLSMNNTISWDVTRCGLEEVCRRFGGTYCLPLQRPRISQASNKLCLHGLGSSGPGQGPVAGCCEQTFTALGMLN
jgi:hypothetical protein